MSLLTGLLPVSVADLTARVIGLHCGFQSFKAIEDDQPSAKAQWLTFWLLFAVMFFSEFLTDSILFWVPWYAEIKVGLLVYLGYYNGAEALYEKGLKQFLSKHREDIDKALTKDGAVAQAKRAMDSLRRPKTE